MVWWGRLSNGRPGWLADGPTVGKGVRREGSDLAACGYLSWAGGSANGPAYWASLLVTARLASRCAGGRRPGGSPQNGNLSTQTCHSAPLPTAPAGNGVHGSAEKACGSAYAPPAGQPALATGQVPQHYRVQPRRQRPATRQRRNRYRVGSGPPLAPFPGSFTLRVFRPRRTPPKRRQAGSRAVGRTGGGVGAEIPSNSGKLGTVTTRPQVTALAAT